jgi:hypothetical protein
MISLSPTDIFSATFEDTMKKSDAHPFYLVRESIGKLLDAYLNSLNTPTENNPITDEERKAINAHIESLNQLLNNFQQRIKQEQTS